MNAPPFVTVAATMFTDQAGLVTPLIVALDRYGQLWQKPGHLPWVIVSVKTVVGDIETTASYDDRIDKEAKH